MKKLIIVAALAVSSATFGAEASYLAQVYDVALTVKTGICRAKKASAATVKYYDAMYGRGNHGVERGNEMGFRQQATRKIVGVLWGCECETIAVPAWRRYRPINGNGRNLGGYAFWDQTVERHFVLPNTVFGWACLNRITDSFKTVEGTWLLANNINPQALFLMGSGFGKASIAANPCRSIISKISGNFAGFRMPGMDDAVGDCPYCGLDSCTIDPFCFGCNWWTPAIRLTAAYGTWSIKFNKTASNRLKQKMRITDSYTFKKAGNLAAILARMERYVEILDKLTLDDDDDDVVEMTPDEVKAAYAYGVIETATVGADGSIVIGEDEIEDYEEAYLSELDYEKLEASLDDVDDDDDGIDCEECGGSDENAWASKVDPYAIIAGIVDASDAS